MNNREHIFPESFKWLMIFIGFVLWNVITFPMFGLWTPALGILMTTVVVIACIKDTKLGVN